MVIKVSSNGMNYNLLDKQEVNDLNNGDVMFIQYYKGKLEWDKDKKYILIGDTGSIVLVGDINQSDDDIINDIAKNSV